jgi:hypothetical protein
MSDPQIKKMALQLSLGERAVQAAVELLDSGASLDEKIGIQNKNKFMHIDIRWIV